MERIATASKAVDLFGAGKHGFKDGDPLIPLEPTYMSAKWHNDMQEEIAGVIETYLGPLNGGDRTQLRQAIAAAIAASGVSGKVNKSGDAMTGALAIVMAALQLSLQNSVNTATLQDHLRLFRGTAAGTRAALQSLGDAANGLSEVDLVFLSAANALVKAFKFKNSGRLEVGADPTLPLEVATKQFVEALLPADATNAETIARVVSGKYVSPANLAALNASPSQAGLVLLATAAQARAQAGNYGISAANLADLSFESAEISITAGGTGSVVHGLGVRPKTIQTFLRCKIAWNGYSVGDEVEVAPIFTSAAFNAQVWSDGTTNIGYVFGSGAGACALYSAITGAISAITIANWRLVIRATV
jgi:hypothetical protein